MKEPKTPRCPCCGKKGKVKFLRFEDVKPWVPRPGFIEPIYMLDRFVTGKKPRIILAVFKCSRHHKPACGCCQCYCGTWSQQHKVKWLPLEPGDKPAARVTASFSGPSGGDTELAALTVETK